ncbi:hypothetical protein TNCV_2475791 [Trichonephila clavipes]|nr:hypothetical protein TNCV_2475791 [Trichonephila clavipes]
MQKIIHQHSRDNQQSQSKQIYESLVESRSTLVSMNPEGSELANIVTNVTKMVTKLTTNSIAKNDANLDLSPRFRQILLELPL